MVSIRRVVRWVLLAGMVPAGLACIGGERDTPEWDLVSASGSSSGNATSSGSTSSGTGGSSSGTGGSGGSSSGTGGGGGTVPTCDGSNDCGTCLLCSVNDSCQALWDACNLDAQCAGHADCEQICATTYVGDPTGFASCSDDCVLTYPGSSFLLVVTCACDQACASDCLLEQPYHCASYFP